mmetsp:Transcript_26146/g.36807  ORF Transcript_26146/g.36807 Transcript_26146/m.36807 type:complete len:348 (+) Transcript_26146:3-1046(+)
MADDGITLTQLFYKLYKQFQSIDNSSLSSNDPIYQRNVSEVLEGFLRVNTFVKDMSMFSPNEELRDIGTSNLKFILVNYYLGETHQKVVDDNRMLHLKEAKAYFVAFLDQLQKLNLLQKEDQEFLNREGKKLDAVTLRGIKISRFKRDKEANAKLNELFTRRKKQTGNEDLEIEQEDEDEAQRNIVLLLIDLCSRKAMESLGFIDDEIPILEGLEKQKKANGGQLPKPKQTAEPLKPIVITSDMVNSLAVGAINQRQEIMKNVFIYSNPATMTPEEWAEQQIRLGNLPDPNQASTNLQQNANNTEHEQEDNDQKNDEKTMKQRAWDDWVEDHPKGSGNMNDNYFKRG